MSLCISLRRPNVCGAAFMCENPRWQGHAPMEPMPAKATPPPARRIALAICLSCMSSSERAARACLRHLGNQTRVRVNNKSSAVKISPYQLMCSRTCAGGHGSAISRRSSPGVRSGGIDGILGSQKPSPEMVRCTERKPSAPPIILQINFNTSPGALCPWTCIGYCIICKSLANIAATSALVAVVCGSNTPPSRP